MERLGTARIFIAPFRRYTLIPPLSLLWLFSTGLPVSGDEMFYRIRGDSLHTVFRNAEGDRLLDQVGKGPERRLSVLGGYFAPKSDFRESLVRSLFRGPP